MCKVLSSLFLIYKYLPLTTKNTCKGSRNFQIRCLVTILSLKNNLSNSFSPSSSSQNLPVYFSSSNHSQIYHPLKHFTNIMTKRKDSSIRTSGVRRSSRLRMIKEQNDDVTNIKMDANENKRSNKDIRITNKDFSNTKGKNNESNDLIVDKKGIDPSLLLLDLGRLVKGELLKRPSATIRSPYVADVKLIRENDDQVGHDEIVQAHAPALDVGGLCSTGSTVYMSERPKGGKTSHAIELVVAPGPNGEKNNNYVLVGCHPSLGEKLAEEVLKRGLLQECLEFESAELMESSYSKGSHSPKKVKGTKQQTINGDGADDEILNGRFLYKQRSYGDSRIDFELVDMKNDNVNRQILIEVKNVVCSDYSAQYAPIKTGVNHCVVIAPETNYCAENDSDRQNQHYKRAGIFPWGKVMQTFEGQKVVSERAIKHLRNLSQLSKNNQDDSRLIKGLKTVVLFVTNRSDCEKVRACHEACPMFASELKSAFESGTMVLSFRVHWTIEGKAYFDGVIPVSI